MAGLGIIELLENLSFKFLRIIKCKILEFQFRKFCYGGMMEDGNFKYCVDE